MVHSIFAMRRRAPCALAAACTATWVALWSMAAPATQAQPATAAPPPVAKADPLDPKARVPALNHESSFLDYRRFDDGRPIGWRAANDTVSRIGGWRVYAREAQQPDTTAPPPSAVPGTAQPAEAGRLRPDAPGRQPGMQPDDAAKPVPPGHGGHKMP